MVPDRAHRKCALMEVGELGERRVPVEGAGRIGGGQVDAGVVDPQHVALGRQRGVESLAGCPEGDHITRQVETPRHRQQVHVSSLR